MHEGHAAQRYGAMRVSALFGSTDVMKNEAGLKIREEPLA
jgi:hypothetical protein